MNNFGDLLGPLVVERMASRTGRDFTKPVGDWQLLSVGSVLHFARNGATVWGSGINGLIDDTYLKFGDLDVRAVRGPRTAQVLRQRGISVPEVFGDPALLLPVLCPDLVRRPDSGPTYRIAVVPNLNDWGRSHNELGPNDILVDPRGDLEAVLNAISSSELTLASSLHGLIVAESLGIPARMMLPRVEHPFKYRDYYEGTGRTTFTPVQTLVDGLEAGGEPPLEWDPDPLMSAFPSELWRPVV